MSAPTQVLFDEPGPRGRALNVTLSIVSALVLAALVAFVIIRFAEAGQLEGDKWSPFTYTVIQQVLLRGMLATLQVAAVATVFALVVGVVFALLRISPRKWISLPSTVVLEVFRGVPVLLLIFGVFYISRGGLSPFWSVVIGLTLYNGMVIAEIVRAGINAVPKGQKEAAMAIGLTNSQAMAQVIMPQAVRSMMPTIVAQIVVLLKDSALGFLVTYRDLLAEVNTIARDYNNLLPTFIVGASIFILINLIVAGFANWLERRLRRKQGRSAAKTV